MVDKDYFNIDEEAMKKNELSDILNEDEEVLIQLTPDKKDYILESVFKGLPVALLWGFIDAMVITMMFSVENSPMKEHWYILIPFFALHLIPVWIYVGRIIKRVTSYKNIRYALTNQRIIIRSGLIGIDYKYFYYHEINAIDVKVGIFDRIFKVGDLYIHSVNKQAVLEDIKNPYQYSNKIQKIITDLKADIYYPNDLRPEENHGYNTRYKRKDDIK